MPSGIHWLDTATAAVVLGLSARQLRELRKLGTFKLGKHYRVISSPQSSRPTYQWHCERIEKLFEVPMEKR